MSYTRYYFKFVLFAIFLTRMCFGQAVCFPLDGSDVNHPNGLFVQLAPAKKYSGPRQNSSSTYIFQIGNQAQLLWDPINGPSGVSSQTIPINVNTELTTCVPGPVNPPPPPPQSVPFYNTPLITGSHAMAVSDFNGDGLSDVAVAVPGSSQLSMYLGNPDGTFQTVTTTAVGSASTKLAAIALADFNNDKKTDIALVDTANNAVYILFGKGDGTFYSKTDGAFAPITLTVGHSPSALTITDVNADGIADIVVTNAADGTVSVMRGLGGGVFIPASVFPVGKNPVSVIARDINGDGNIDLIVADSGSSDLAELFGFGTGGFQNAVFTKTPVPPTYLSSADFNNDGIPDIVALSEDLNAVAMFLGSFQGKLTFAGSFLVPNLTADFSVNDFNGDGNLDLLVPDTDSGSGILLLGRGDGTFIAPSVYGGVSGLTSIATADFNGDGKPDLIMTGAAAAGSTTSTLSLFTGLGNGQFQTPVNIPVTGRTDVIAVGDFNKDGRPDLAVSGSQLNILLSQANGSFQQGGQYPNLVPSIVADLNKDGRVDLAGPFNNGLGVMLGNGDGTFRPAVTFAAGSNPKTAAAADFNGDSTPDIAVLNGGTIGNPNDPGGISILLGSGAGAYLAAANVTAGFNPRALAVADVNGDGKPDLIVATGTNAGGTSFQISVLPGKGDGTFLAPFNIPLPVGETPNSIAIVDLDGDGNPDIVLGDCCTDATTAYLRGNGDGTFQPVAPFYGGNNVRAIAVGDWNGDGKPDLALACSPTDNPSLSAIVPLVNHLANTPSMSVTSGASFVAGPVAPNSIASSFGNNLTTGTATFTGDPTQPVTVLGNTIVTVTDSKGVARPASLYYVSPTQINYLIPAATALGQAKIAVTAPNGVTTATANVINTAPGLFTVNINGLAAGSGVLVNGLAQSSFNLSYTDPVLGALALPINLGTRLNQTYLTLYGTGFRNRSSLDAVVITVGGVFTPALYAGAQNEYPGLDQLNFQVPFSLAGSGIVTINMTVNGVAANPVNVTIQ